MKKIILILLILNLILGSSYLLAEETEELSEEDCVGDDFCRWVDKFNKAKRLSKTEALNTGTICLVSGLLFFTIPSDDGTGNFSTPVIMLSATSLYFFVYSVFLKPKKEMELLRCSAVIEARAREYISIVSENRRKLIEHWDRKYYCTYRGIQQYLKNKEKEGG